MTEQSAKNSKKRDWRAALILGILVIVCGCGLLVFVFGSSGNKTTATVPTPDVAGIYTQAYLTAIAALPTRTAMPPFPTDTAIPSPTVTIPAVASTNSTDIIVDVPSILGKSIGEAEHVLGVATLVTGPIDQFEGKLAGGQYRDYRVDRYTATMAYDKSGISRVFFILDGMSDENYALQDWNIILPKFGVHIGASPDLEAPLRVAWNNYDGLFVTVAGQPVYTIQIAQAEYHP